MRWGQRVSNEASEEGRCWDVSYLRRVRSGRAGQGITNTIASIPGMASVAITGMLLHHFDSWTAVFALCSLVQFLGSLPYLLFGSTTPLPGMA